MVKSPPKLLRYKGTEYEAVPRVVRYAGTIYVIAQDPLAPDSAEIDTTPIPQSAPGEGAQMGEQLGQDLQTVVTEEDVKKTIEPMIEALNAEAQKYLEAVGLKTSGAFQVVAVERDGLDLMIPIHTGNFSQLPTETAVYFDFLVELPGAEAMEEGARGEQVAPPGKKGPPGSWSKGEHLFIDKLWYAVENVLDGVTERLSGSKTNQEISVGLCDKFLVSTPKGAGPLLDSLAFLQRVPKVTPGAMRALPEGEPGSEDAHSWLSAFITKLRDAGLEKIQHIRFHQQNLFKRDELRGVLQVLQNERMLKKELVDRVNAELDAFSDDTEYAEFIGETLKGGKSALRMSREAVEKAVRSIAAVEGYKASAPVHIATDAKTDEVIAKIDAPGNPTYTFRKGAGSSPPQLTAAGIELCGFQWEVATAEHAARLLTAVVDVTEAAQNAVDPSLNADSEKVDEVKILKMLETRRRQVEEERAKAQQQPVSQPPSQQEIYESPTTTQTPLP